MVDNCLNEKNEEEEEKGDDARYLGFTIFSSFLLTNNNYTIILNYIQFYLGFECVYLGFECKGTFTPLMLACMTSDISIGLTVSTKIL